MFQFEYREGTSDQIFVKEGEDVVYEMEESDEEVVELEFETAVQKMHSHVGYGMFCPNETHQLREQPPASYVPLKATTGIGLDSFWISERSTPLLPAEATTSTTVVSDQLGDEASQQGKGFGLFDFLRKGRDDENALNSPLLSAAAQIQSSSNAFTSSSVAILQSSSIAVSSNPRDEAIEQAAQIPSSFPAFSAAPGIMQTSTTTVASRQPRETLPGPTQPPEHVIVVDPPGVTSSPSAVAQPSLVLPESRSPRSVEIVKSVVYGGLMESMASLSVVSSAAASNSNTLNIVVLGLANLVGGLIVLFHNLKELRYGESDQTDEEIEIRYKKELGKRQHFPLHVFLAVISYFIFGLLPPAIYGSTFRETNDRDYKMLAVAAASLLSIFFLAIGKAYARGERSFTGYLKTVSYYISSAVMVAGISFAVGELAEKFVQQIGWLEPQAPARVSGIQFQPSWASSY